MMSATAQTATGSLRLGLVQMAVGSDKSVNLARAAKLVAQAAANGAAVVALPECFNSPYGTQYFGNYAEEFPGQSTKALSDIAKSNKVYLVGGSIPEREGRHLYNTCTVYNPQGELLATHRKIHLFDIDVPGKIRFQESETLTAGNSFTCFDAGAFRIGVGICYDIRFPELAQIYASKGCHLLLYPGAFNMTTGPAHWELLQRARAVDNQLYVATVSPARDPEATYTAWGHSTVIDPWGEVKATTAESEDIVYAEIDLNRIAEVRQSVPTASQKRHDMYTSPAMV